MSYNTLKVFLISIFLFYFFGGVFTSNKLNGEVYPFYHWFVFRDVPSKIQAGYAIRILEYEGKPLNPPIFLKNAYGLYVNTNMASPQYSYIVRVLGENIVRKQQEEIKRHREILERSFLSQSVTYEVVKIEFDTLDRWGTEEWIKMERIIIFNTRDKVL
ncbi:hypothetical protein IIA95_03070 [Patescibacteria group bacterium]|nr:hypothetical protein [Patescibacteria group bacterium]